MKSPFRLFLIISLLLTGVGKSFSQGERCSSIQPFCAGNSQLIFPNSNPGSGGLPNAESGPNYGCLASRPFPSWYYLQIAAPGDLEFTISQSENQDGSGRELDVDFIVWGPFDETDNYCSNSSLSATNIVDCSWADFATEVMTIPNAQPGKIYVVMITNYVQLPGYISLQQTNTGGGSTDCSIVGSTLGPDQKVCGNEPVELDATNPHASTYSWFILNEVTNNYDIIPNETGPKLIVRKTGNYQVTVKSNFFGSEDSDQVYIEFFDKPVAHSASPVTGCSANGNAVFDLTKAIPNLIGSQTGPFTANFFLNEADYQNRSPIQDPVNFTGNVQTVLGVVSNEITGCESEVIQVDLQSANLPFLEWNEITPVCIDFNANLNSRVFLGQDLGPGFTYEWSVPNDPDGDGLQNPVLILYQLPSERIIHLIVTNKESGCSSQFTTEIRAYSPPRNVNVEISGNDFAGGGYQVTALVTGAVGYPGVYEYSLNEGGWQENPTFTGVPGGTHQITAREINGCGSAKSALFRLIGYPRFFTPNNDGYNDTWNIITGEKITVLKILIFDRYGKLIKQLNPNSGGWDGTFNNYPMPADDYWFLIEYRDSTAEGVHQFRANFTLTR